MQPRRGDRARPSWLPRLALVGLTAPFGSCAPGTTGEPALEQRDPAALAWVAPGADEALATGEPVVVAVATQNPAALVVHFAVDGAEIDACAATGDDCRAGDLRSVVATFPTAGAHTLRAWFDGAGGTVEATRTLQIAASLPAPPTPTRGATDTEDPRLTGDGDSVGSAPVLMPQAPGVDALQDDDLTATASETPDALFDVAAGGDQRGDLDAESLFHHAFDGRDWAVLGGRVLLRAGDVEGDFDALDACMGTYGDAIARYADLGYVSRATVAALMLAATDCAPAAGTGLFALPGRVCAAVAPEQGLDAAGCAARMAASPDFAIDVAVRYVASRRLRALHQGDPPLVAATFATGALVRSDRDAWRVRAPVGYVTRFVRAYNAYRTWESVGQRRPEVSP